MLVAKCRDLLSTALRTEQISQMKFGKSGSGGMARPGRRFPEGGCQHECSSSGSVCDRVATLFVEDHYVKTQLVEPADELVCIRR